MKYLYPKENGKTYDYYKKLINRALLNIGVDDVWNIKFLSAIIIFIIVAAVTKTNIYYKSIEIIEDTGSKSAMLFAVGTDQKPDKKLIEQQKKNEKMIFEQINKSFDFEQLRGNESTGISKIARYMELNNLKADDEAVEDMARRMYQKLEKYYENQKRDYLEFIFWVTLAFFLPEVFLYLRSYLIKYYIYNEYLQLEVTAIMVGKLEPIKVEEILNVLSDNSKYFKKYIDEIRYNYFNVKDGSGGAFDSVIAKVTHKELKYLLKALQQAAESDLKITIENLENQRKSNKEFRSIKEQSKLKKKELIAIIVIFVILAAVCFYTFGPFQKLMNDFSI